MAVGKFFTDMLKGAVNTNYQQDYRHAAKTFQSNGYSLLPKTKRWWHVYFELSPEALELVNSVRKNMSGVDTLFANFTNNPDLTTHNSHVLSVLVKNVKLPSYRFDVKRSNQYNRQLLSLNKISYEPISIEFHDDSVNVIRNLWDLYYTYYVQDTRYRKFSGNLGLGAHPAWIKDYDQKSVLAHGINGISNDSAIYSTAFPQRWGLDTFNTSFLSGTTIDRASPYFFNSIRVYHFSRALSRESNPTYSEYMLVNPMISSFEHDTLDYSDGGSTINRMQVEYESVLYSQGTVDDNIDSIPSWKAVQDNYYDKSKSPLGNPIASVFGQGGLLNTGKSVIGSLSSGGLGGVAKAALTVGQSVQTWKNAGGLAGIGRSLAGEGLNFANQTMAQTTQNIISGNKTISVPTALTKLGLPGSISLSKPKK